MNIEDFTGHFILTHFKLYLPTDSEHLVVKEGRKER